MPCVIEKCCECGKKIELPNVELYRTQGVKIQPLPLNRIPETPTLNYFLNKVLPLLAENTFENQQRKNFFQLMGASSFYLSSFINDGILHAEWQSSVNFKLINQEMNRLKQQAQYRDVDIDFNNTFFIKNTFNSITSYCYHCYAPDMEKFAPNIDVVCFFPIIRKDLLKPWTSTPVRQAPNLNFSIDVSPIKLHEGTVMDLEQNSYDPEVEYIAPQPYVVNFQLPLQNAVRIRYSVRTATSAV